MLDKELIRQTLKDEFRKSLLLSPTPGLKDSKFTPGRSNPYLNQDDDSDNDCERQQIFKRSTPQQDKYEKVITENNKTLVLIIIVLVFCLIASFLFIIAILLENR